MQIIDADGHINDHACGEEIARYLPKGNQMAKLFPEFDHLHFRYLKQNRRATGNPSPEDWHAFLDRTGIAWTVLYPTAGLAVGRIMAPDWAVAACRAYNNWLHEKFVGKNSRLKGMALIPFQDVDAAVEELRRAVKELGMLGAMLPSNGLRFHLGAKEYWPIYEEAEKLGCALAVHGGCYGDLGFNSFGIFPATRALGMPFPLAIAATGMIVEGMLDRFPKLRVGFLEGGTAWIPIVIDRLEREMEYGGLQLKRKPEEYFTGGRIFVGCEGNEKALAYAIERVGSEPFMFASDFPHEISLGNCMEEINEILEREDLKQEHKAAILGDNARRFYGI